ncbi:MAG: ATP-binding protein [Pseudomonadota bacterium]|nr:ATP-binding protein [Pseudomonadota bacterium]
MRSITRYLIAWVMGALCLGGLVIVGVTYLVTLDEFNEAFDADLKNVAEALGTHRHPELGQPVPALARFPARSDVADPAEIVTLTWTTNGQLVFSSDERVAVPFRSQEALTQLRIGGEDWVLYTDVTTNGVSQAAQRTSARHESAAESASKITVPILGMVLFVAGLMLFALRRGLAPLDAAAQDIAARTAASLAPVETDGVPAEIRPLVDSINGLLLRLAQALSRQRSFLADAAHELRTPVTALRLQLQLLRRAHDDSGRAEAMAELQAGIDRSQGLIEKLLQVARTEADGLVQRREAVDLSELARSVVARMNIKADRQRLDLGAVAESGPVVEGDPDQLAVLLDNLVENALRYTPAGGAVDVMAGLLEGLPTLRVLDTGPGIGLGEREQVFDRFYRGRDAARLAREPGGSGLGLAIVRAIAELHGAVVSLHDGGGAPGNGLEVRVAFSARG